MLSPILALFAHISKPLWLNIRSTGVEVAGGQKTFSSNGCSTLNVHCVFCLNFTLHEWRRRSLHGHKSQNRDRDSRVPRPRLQGSRPRLVKTSLETKTEVLRTPSLLHPYKTTISNRYSLVAPQRGGLRNAKWPFLVALTCIATKFLYVKTLNGKVIRHSLYGSLSKCAKIVGVGRPLLSEILAQPF